MKVNIEKKMQIVFSSILLIILTYIIYFIMINNGQVSIQYKTSEDGTVQIFYDNHNAETYPFDEIHSLTKKLEKTDGDFKTISIPISLKNSNKVRIDIDGINQKIELNKIYFSTMGISARSISKNDITNNFNVINDGEWNYENNILTLIPKGADLFFASANIDISLRIIKMVSVLAAFLFNLLLYMLWKLTGFRLSIENIKSKGVIAAFLALTILPGLLYQITGKNIGDSTENRTLKAKPSLSINNVLIYPKQYEDYYNDNLAFKASLVKLNSIEKYNMLNISPARYVIKGSDGWLFYNSKYKSDADTLGDYQHTNRLSEAELEKQKNILVDRENYLKEKGISMYVFIPPNKSQVYSEFMPSKYKRLQGSSRIDELINYLRGNTDIEIINPMEKLMDYKPKYQLYYKFDTHWNNLGAYIGYTELMKCIDNNFKYKDLNDLQIVSTPIQNGDLVNMVNLTGSLSDVQYTISDFKGDIETTLVEQKETSEFRYTSTNLNGKKLLCFRDSFSISVIPYLSKEFQESVFLWGVPYSKEIIEKEKPDIVIFESVERLANFK